MKGRREGKRRRVDKAARLSDERSARRVIRRRSTDRKSQPLISVIGINFLRHVFGEDCLLCQAVFGGHLGACTRKSAGCRVSWCRSEMPGWGAR